ncbi:MAG: hypothetical protein PWQ81_733 [Bacteroidota bacterium]|jgi:hypothetical protein|nr:hypothetical protein [Methermicoccus sp.]MBZ4675279.1 hypothetical protein [Dysgonamonadaceae bacterium]MDI3505511.1 hypothetical protein [Bacteroidota bacterium]MDK2837318.1 hypothetical protein [Bacteroidota bacterium]
MKEEKYHNSSSSEICAIKEEVKKSEMKKYHNPCAAWRQHLSPYLKGTATVNVLPKLLPS